MRQKTVCLYAVVMLAALGAVMQHNVVLVKSALAVTSPDEVLEDPELERRARSLSKELRCLVCQNQSIDDSNADLARDLRQLVRERLLAGDTDEEILDFATERYGDFVLLRPPMKPSTWLLWYGPIAIFVLAGIAVFFYVRRRRDEPLEVSVNSLSPDEQAKLDRLLERQGADPR
ncbi:MAG: cytochrome c-type biogenesis protein [Pseudomonadota bacterium]